jgi:hypothetical protein
MTAPAIQDPRDWLAFARERAVRDARDTFHKFTPLVVLNASGAPIQYSTIHLSWIAHVNYCWEHGLHAGLFAPFGHGKSSAFGLPLLAWLIGRNTQERIKIVCAGDDHAAQRVGLVKMILESPSYRAVFPNVVPGGKWTDHMLFVERSGFAIDATLEARGVFTKGVGGRATTILFDDVCDLSNSGGTNNLTRDRVKDFITKQWMSRLEPRTHVLYLATPWHADDASYFLQKQAGWCWLTQRISADFRSIEQEVQGAGADYASRVQQHIADMLAGQ